MHVCDGNRAEDKLEIMHWKVKNICKKLSDWDAVMCKWVSKFFFQVFFSNVEEINLFSKNLQK